MASNTSQAGDFNKILALFGLPPSVPPLFCSPILPAAKIPVILFEAWPKEKHTMVRTQLKGNLGEKQKRDSDEINLTGEENIALLLPIKENPTATTRRQWKEGETSLPPEFVALVESIKESVKLILVYAIANKTRQTSSDDTTNNIIARLKG
eukprot:9202821-Ditylum_brightwellii.AAC.1